ncbi:MAG: metallopeptidase TldD-related protein [Sphingopyxis sp.]
MIAAASSPQMDFLLDRAADAASRALRAGADASHASVQASRSVSASVRLGVLEDIDHAESHSLSLRLFIGQRSATLSSVDTRAAALNQLVERAMTMARHAPENPWAGLAPQELLATGYLPELDLVDRGSEPEPEALRDMARALEDASLGVAGVTNSEGGTATYSRSSHAMVTSHGFARGSSVTGFSLSASVIAGAGSDMQRDYDWHSARHASDLESAERIGRCAGERAVARLGPGTMPSGAMPILFDPRVSGSLFGHLLSAMAGPAIVRGKSFLIGREGAKLFPDAITLHDDPHRLRGTRSYAFDGEGLATAPSTLVKRGHLASWLCDAASARQLGRAPTGHASGGGGITTGNLALDSGNCARVKLMADIRHGVLVTELIGQGVDMLTGDYSRGASGWRIVDGEIAGPVSGFTIAGNLLDMFADLRAADDVDRRTSTHVPTLRTDSMIVAGD